MQKRLRDRRAIDQSDWPLILALVRVFSSMAIDQAHKHNNAAVKDDGEFFLSHLKSELQAHPESSTLHIYFKSIEDVLLIVYCLQRVNLPSFSLHWKESTSPQLVNWMLAQSPVTVTPSFIRFTPQDDMSSLPVISCKERKYETAVYLLMKQQATVIYYFGN